MAVGAALVCGAACGADLGADIGGQVVALPVGGTITPTPSGGAAWDRLVVVGGYSQKDVIAADAKVPPARLPKSQVWDGGEGYCLLMFTAGDQVVEAGDVLRQQADFCPDSNFLVFENPTSFVKGPGQADGSFPKMRPVG